MARFPVPRYTLFGKIAAVIHYYSFSLVGSIFLMALPSYTLQYNEYVSKLRRKDAVRGTLVAGTIWIDDPTSLLWKNGYFGRQEGGQRSPRCRDLEEGGQKTQLMPEECMFLLLSFSDRLLEIEHDGV
jgi:hypothetical protein